MKEMIRQSVLAIAERVEITGDRISNDEWAQLRMNSYEREFLLQFVDNATIASIADGTLKNSSQKKIFGACSTYDEFAINRLIPELLRRLNIND